MDWQHLIMNGENLGEYAALLAAEGLLGREHANSGWGTFDDDNMVGATQIGRASCREREYVTEIHVSYVEITLHVISTLRQRGIDTVNDKKDWQQLNSQDDELRDAAGTV